MGARDVYPTFGAGDQLQARLLKGQRLQGGNPAFPPCPGLDLVEAPAGTGSRGERSSSGAAAGPGSSSAGAAALV